MAALILEADDDDEGDEDDDDDEDDEDLGQGGHAAANARDLVFLRLAWGPETPGKGGVSGQGGGGWGAEGGELRRGGGSL